MKTSMPNAQWIPVTVYFLLLWGAVSVHSASNLTCYQCIKHDNEVCGKDKLLPCPPVSDRCVTHITKSAEKGFTIKRECGLGPCGFDDMMINKGLGWDSCDRSSDEYFCLYCCRESGCNKSAAPDSRASWRTFVLAQVLLLTWVLVGLAQRYPQPPYFPVSYEK